MLLPLNKHKSLFLHLKTSSLLVMMRKVIKRTRTKRRVAQTRCQRMNLLPCKLQTKTRKHNESGPKVSIHRI